MPTLVLISSGIMLISIVMVLIAINPIIALVTIVGFGGTYYSVMLATRKILKRSSKRVANESTQVIKSLQEGLGGIRDILIDGSQDLHCQLYRSADLPLRRAQGNIHIISTSPRYVIEAIGITIIAMIAYFMSLPSSGIIEAIPVLGTLAVGAQRLLPVLQQAYSAISNVKGAESSVVDILYFLNQKIPEVVSDSIESKLYFKKEIMLHDVNFQYNTLVGERGVLLFGGQRIAIARALYKKVDVIIFDEATSALDNETEKAVISSIDSLGDELTVLIVAHRLTTLQNCDKIFEIGGQGILREGTYNELVAI
jgi:ABC-type multidrug transport system fused ATPase/permease subunit